MSERVRPDGASTVPSQGSLMDAAIYVEGRRVATASDLEGSFRLLDEHPTGFLWAGLYRPSRADMDVLADRFEFSPLLVEDTVNAHQRPKYERYGPVVFLVLHAARYQDEDETVDFGEVHALMGDRFIVTLRHSETTDLAAMRHELEARPEVLARGPHAVFISLLDCVVDDYKPVVLGIENDIDEIEAEVLSAHAGVSRRIYQLSREVLDFQRAVRPLDQIVDDIITDPGFDTTKERLRQVLRDIRDHSTSVNEHAELMHETLKGTLDLNLALQTQRQNEEVAAMTKASLKQAEDSRRIAAWAGVLFVPSLVAGTYGMNFHNMPELSWQFGYLWGLGLMLVTGVVMYLVFKWRGWL